MNESRFSRVAIVTSKQSWFFPHALSFGYKLKDLGINAQVVSVYDDISNEPEVVFMLSYFSIVAPTSLKKHPLNLVVHESALPQGKGWAPLFWQILEGKNSIPIVLFEATNYVDAGDIYLTDTIELDGDELYAEIRQKQAEKTVQMCLTFLGQGVMLKPLKQTGIESFYNKRTPKDSELNTAQPLEQLFNQLRIASNEDHPAFFYRNGVKYIIKISKESVKGV